jgi:type IV secretory pathway TrbD component
MQIEKITQPLHISLTEEILFMGVPKRFMILNGGLAALAGLYLHLWYLLPINFALYIASLCMVQSDTQFFDVLICYVKTKKHYYS